MMKKLILLALTTILSLNLFCQVHWTKHPDNPVLTYGSPAEWDDVRSLSSVIYYDSTYHMWYNSGEFVDTARIGHATSPDGVNWMKDTNNPVLDVGPVGAWDDHAAYYGDVLIIDSIFHMWYTGHTGQINNRNYQIGHATSPDGINWTKDPNNPVLTAGPEGSWDDWWIAYCKVVYVDGTLHMCYSGWGGADDIITGHATSADGVNWTKDTNNPVLDVGQEGAWDDRGAWAGPVIFDGSTYQMWYEGGRNNYLRIGYATSDVGSQWEKYGTPVLRPGPPGSWDNKEVYGASVLFDSTEYKYKMWYTGVSYTGFWGIGYAESDTCSDITRPELFAEDTLYQPFIDVTCSEDGIIYLVPYLNYYTLDAIREACIDSVEAIANTPVQIPLEGQPEGNLRLYARDNGNNISNPHKIVIILDPDGTIESRVSSAVSIYPNPANAMVNIQTNKPGDYSIVIETLNGKEVSNGRFNGNTHQIDLSSFQKGVYLITVRSKDFVTTRKIIKL